MPNPGEPPSSDLSPHEESPAAGQSVWAPSGPGDWSTAKEEPSAADWHPEQEEIWAGVGEGQTRTPEELERQREAIRRARRRKRKTGLAALLGRPSRKRRRSHWTPGPSPSLAAQVATRQAAPPDAPARPTAPSASPPTTTRPSGQIRTGPGVVRPHSGRRRRRSARRRRRRRIKIAIYSILGAAAVFLGVGLIPALMAGQALERGRDAVNEGKAALLDLQEGSKAGESFAVAEASFRDASRWASNPLIRVQGLIPVVGRTADAIGRLSRAGERIAVAGSALSQGVSALPGGLPGLAPAGGRIPVEAIQELAPAVTRARIELEGSDREIGPISTAWVVPPVSGAITLVQTELADALRIVRAADDILGGLPKLAGVNGTRRYFLAAENPAELRGTGGIIGMFSIMTIDDGRIDIGPFTDKPPPSLDPGELDPPPNLGEPYAQFDSSTFWLSTNTTPDAPTAATMIENLWRKVKGQRLDGVIFVTPQALSALMTALGPVEIPKLDYTVTAENVVDFTTNEAFFLFENKQYLRNRALGLVAQEVLNRFFASNSPKLAVKALVDAASNGYIDVHSADPKVQQGFAEAGIDGAFSPGGGDFFAVVANSLSRNKVDYYVKRTIDYGVKLEPTGGAVADAAVTLENTAPTLEGFNEALGPFPTHRRSPNGLLLESGEAFQFLSFYCAASCATRDASSASSADVLSQYSRADAQMFAGSIRLKSKQSHTFHLALQTTHGWSGDDTGGTYRLRLRDQPLVQPTTIRLNLELPPGMRMIYTNVPITFQGDRLLWQGTLGEVQDIEIRFERPLFDKLWIWTKDFISRPVFKIG